MPVSKVINLLITIAGQISQFKFKYATGVRHSVSGPGCEGPCNATPIGGVRLTARVPFGLMAVDIGKTIFPRQCTRAIDLAGFLADLGVAGQCHHGPPDK